MLFYRIVFFIAAAAVCIQVNAQRIITLSSAITETVDALGMGTRIVATDVTSEYPAYAKKIPRVSKNRTLSAESIIAFRPSLVIAPAAEMPATISKQLKNIGIKVVLLHQDYSVNGAAVFIKQVAAALGVPEKGENLARQTIISCNDALRLIKANNRKSPKVLFIYARGAGVMSVAGKGSSMDAIIKLAGGQNVIKEFSDFKPYSTEALVQANPDIILLFDFGLNSLGGKNHLLQMPGVRLTNAGKHQRIIAMDAHLLINFSYRLASAMLQLNRELMR